MLGGPPAPARVPAVSSPVPPPLPFIPEPLPAPHLQPPDPRRGRWRRHLWPPHLLGGLVHRTLVRPLGLESCSRPGAISWAPGWGWGVRGHLMTDLHCSLNPRTRGVLPTSEGPPRSLRGASPLPQTKSPVSVDSAGAEQCASAQAWKPSSQHAGEKRGVAGLLLGRTERAARAAELQLCAQAR